MDKGKEYIRDGRSPIPESETTSRVMSANRGKDTKPELMLRKALYRNGLSGYRLHWKKAPGRPDICYPGKKLAIFVNGCFWHRCPHCNPPMPKTHAGFWESKFSRNAERDKRKINELEAAGWIVLVFWECQIKNNIDICVDRVSSIIQGLDTK
ncbi:MAG: very short patch repair endonuclease [Chloroflexi bacterium]|nr:MAG: very short patch repair endonuclease [Chloroflexota bacterium]RLC82712.1 MAG: very short patch repair endonuclease [Chloroflexota bacterium]